MITLKKLSEMTGFSIATISRVLNNDKTLKTTSETRKLIKEIAKNSGYKTLQTKKKERRNKEKVNISAKIGLLSARDTENTNDPYYIYLKNFIEDICFSKKIEIIKMKYDMGKKKYILVPKKKLDGIIVVGHFSHEEIDFLPEISKNIVFLDCAPKDGKFSSVVADLGIGVKNGIDYLFSLGHEKICFVGPKYDVNIYNEKILETKRVSFEEYTKDMNVSILDAEKTIEDAKEKTLKFLEKERPSAFFAVNESVAIGILNALTEKNIKVPEEISILSYNNTIFSKFIHPKLSSVSINAENMARLAINQALIQAKNKNYEPIQINIFPIVVAKESTR